MYDLCLSFGVIFQAVRYLMRFQTQYMCELMNIARHAAFGKEAAKMAVASLPTYWPKVIPLSFHNNQFEHYSFVEYGS